MPHRISAFPFLSLTFKRQILKSVILVNLAPQTWATFRRKYWSRPFQVRPPGTGFPEM